MTGKGYEGSGRACRRSFRMGAAAENKAQGGGNVGRPSPVGGARVQPSAPPVTERQKTGPVMSPHGLKKRREGIVLPGEGERPVFRGIRFRAGRRFLFQAP